MAGDPYEVSDDPACYPGTAVLINLLDIRDADALAQAELELSARRAQQSLPSGKFDPAHYRAIHRHLFQDVYAWAGKDRTIWTHKGGASFSHPDYIAGEMKKRFADLKRPEFLPGSDDDAFIRAAAYFFGEVNAIHPFREGNGRTQLAFLRLLGLRAGHPFRSEAVEPAEFLHAMIRSFHNDPGPLIDELERMRA